MLSYIWAAMIIISFAFGFFNNNIDAVTNAAFSGCSDSVNVVISLLGIMCFWSGLMEIAKRSGLTKKIAKILFFCDFLRIFFIIGSQSGCRVPPGYHVRRSFR